MAIMLLELSLMGSTNQELKPLKVNINQSDNSIGPDLRSTSMDLVKANGFSDKKNSFMNGTVKAASTLNQYNNTVGNESTSEIKFPQIKN